MRMKSERIRICDIAEELGLSTATVSNVIHGRTNKVSDETARRVQELLEKREYIPSMAGILLAQNDSGMIGVVINRHEKYEMRVDEPNMWVHKSIPFSDLHVECAPMLLLNNGHIFDSKTINSKVITNCFAKSFRQCDDYIKPVTVFTDVAPKELVDKLDPNSPDIKFDKLFK